MSRLTSLTRMWLTRSRRPFYFSDSNDSFLRYHDADNLGLYVHIPFCRTLCAFCPYCKVIYETELAKGYVAALIKEIDMVGKMTGGDQKIVTSLYFGGGTPALLLDDIARIIKKINEYFIITDGIGLELHPLDVTVSTLRKLKDIGISKISIGIQSFQRDFLQLLGRPFFDYTCMFDALRQVRFDTVSMDFIFALPGQSIDHLKKDIETAFSHQANHIAVYPFIDFSYTNRNFRKVCGRDKKRLFYQLIDFCNKSNLNRDSIWTFSKDGKSKYSSMTRENFLGFGCSATTLLRDQFKINTFSVTEYVARIDHGLLPTALTMKFSLRQRMVYYLFWELYSMKLNTERFERFFSRDLHRYYGFELLLARLLGFIKKETDGYKMTAKGSYYYHYYEHFYTLSYIDQMWSLMKNTPFPEELIIR